MRRKIVTSQSPLKRAPGQRAAFAAGLTRVEHAQKQQPLSDMPYASGHWNYCGLGMTTSRHPAETRVAAKVG